MADTIINLLNLIEGSHTKKMAMLLTYGSILFVTNVYKSMMHEKELYEGLSRNKVFKFDLFKNVIIILGHI